MGRASGAQKAERLNRARTLLRRFDQLPDAVEQLAQDCSISPRQAYRYLQQAQRLKEPVAVSESKLAFTVKLPPSLIQRVRLYASVKNLSISEVVSRALLALLPARARAWLSEASRLELFSLEYRFDRLFEEKLAQVFQVLVPENVGDQWQVTASRKPRR